MKQAHQENAASNKETRGFQTEVKQLLHLMINSLYSNKEIFLRELISNAADAVDKLRFLALEKPELLGKDTDLKVTVTFDKKAGTLHIKDNGIGMSRGEAIDNLGTIAKSGSREFLKSLTGDKAKDSSLIGQFGVGFYSSFIVADEVEVRTRHAELPANEAVSWVSKGEGDFEVETIEKEDRGTEIILHLKKAEKDFLDDHKLREVIRKYCDHINLPVMMLKQPEPAAEGEEKKEKPAPEFEAINKATALWTLSKKDISDEQYKEFYKYISHDYSDPALWSHNKVEGKQEYTSLIYIPARAPFDMYDQERKHGLKLYIQKVFIMDDAEHFLPRYLRFVKGVVDSKDLPLNVSREILQHSALVDKIKSAISKRAISMLEKIAEKDDEYQKIWDQFGKVLKEGPIEDSENKEAIAKLLRFASTHNANETQTVSLDAYIARMKDGQEHIYFITGEAYTTAKHSPQLEVFLKKGIEVLLLTDPVDEWLVTYLTEFAGKKLQSVAKGDLDLGKLEDEKEKETHKKLDETFESMIKQTKEALKDRVQDVRLTHRLTNSPSCVVQEQNAMGLQMQRMMESMGQKMPAAKPILELNPDHHLVKKLHTETDDAKFGEWANVLLDEAILADGGHLEDPAAFIQRLNKLLVG